MCWLYSASNLLVIQHLETLYLGGNNVRVVCGRVWRINQVCASRTILATGTRNWLVSGDSPEMAHMWSMQEGEASWQLDHYRTKSTIWPFSYLATRTCDFSTCLNREWVTDSPKPSILQKNDFPHSLTYPTINTLIPIKCRELSERILRDKP